MSEQRIELGKKMVVRQRNYRRVRDRALARLAKAYPDDYKKLIEQEKANDVKAGKVWNDIDGNSSDIQAASADVPRNTASNARNQGSNAGNYGGEA